MTDSKSPETTPLAHVFADDSGLSHEDVLADLDALGFDVPESIGRLMETVNEGVAASKQARMREARARLAERRRTGRFEPKAGVLDREALIRGIRSFGQQAAAFHRKLDIERMSDSELASLLEDLQAVNRTDDEEG